jgi:hypothetical protein
VPRTTFPRDRFDDVTETSGRVGAHRAENPRMRGGIVFLWAAVTTVVLVVVGIFGTLVVSGRIVLFPEPVATPTTAPQLEPVIDPTYPVLVLNATGEAGLATQTRDAVVAAGWPDSSVIASDAQSPFEVTTVYYVNEADEAAALGLADVIGGAQIEQNEQYAQFYPAEVEGDASRVLTVVLGTDRVAPPAEETPAP